tara:strand:+ start:592 stop:747 length:156 start_codon:yes stop_codon:yes gene_type:complete
VKTKEQLLQELRNQLGELNRIWEQQELELSDEEYIQKFDSIYESIKKLEYE